MNKKYHLAIISLLLLFTSGLASASHINVTYSGNIDFVLTDNGTGQFSGIGVGSTITNSINYGMNDSNAVITPHADNETDYLFSGVPYGGQINSGSLTANNDQAVIVASNGTPIQDPGLNELGQLAGMTISPGDLTDIWTARTEDSISNLEFGVSIFSFDDLSWQTNELFTSMPPAISGSDLTAFFILETDVTGNVTFFALGEVDNIAFSAVPIPAAIWLFGTGLLGLFGVAKRKKPA